MGFSHHKNLPYFALQLLLLVFYCSFAFATATDTLKANEFLSDSDSLVSNGNSFKLSFFSPPNSSLRFVGIMFDLPVMTVVWVANRNTPLSDSAGRLEISSQGNLVILDGRKKIVWSTNLSTSAANHSAVLLDTGNLVLQDNSNNAYIWQSFEHASDTWLGNMTILTDLSNNERNILTSWKSPDDPAPGSFTLTIEPLGVAELYIWKDGYPYWRSGPLSKDNTAVGLGINSPGTAFLTLTFENSSVFQYLVLNSTGNLENKVWSDEKKGWNVELSPAIRNKCDLYDKCGPFASCNADNVPVCTCFPGFMPTSNDEWVTGNWTRGCTRKAGLRCNRNKSMDEFQQMKSVKLPDNYKWNPSFEGDCGGACLSNCSCAAYANSSEIGCLHWSGNLTDTQKFTFGDGDDLYIRLAYSELGNTSRPRDKKHDRRLIIAIPVVLGFIIISICSYLLPKLVFSYRAKKDKNRMMLSKAKGTNAEYSEESAHKHEKHGVKLEELPIFTFQMLSNATNIFDSVNKLGQGGFGIVYKGKLPDGLEIAIKRLAKSSNQGVEEFMNEVEVISRLQHRNLVRLIGCCVEYEEKMLVYEYMPNGSLDAYLFNPHKRGFVDWKTCKSIIEGICRGLLYLHRDSRLRIIHRDLKASNILLDEDLNPKISDFGMARIFCDKNNQANTKRVVGTYGYMSPEYALHGIFSEKSDVYSFGVLLLEIVSGKKNCSFYNENEQLFLIAYAWKLWNEGKIVELVDPAFYNGGMEDDVERYANVGLLCVQEIAADRPTVSIIVSMLSCEIADLPQPKQPAFLGMQMSSTMRSRKCSANNVTISKLEGR